MLRAVIFDFNGIICNDEHIHALAFQKVFAEEGIEFSEEEYYERYLPFADRGVFEGVLAARKLKYDEMRIMELIERKSRHYSEQIKDRLELFPGVKDLIDKMRGRYALAIASGALRREIEFVLSATGIRDAFGAIVGAEDVGLKSKPDPIFYLRALERLNETPGEFTPIRPSECLVIEDTPAGIEGAHLAGMRCVAVANTYPHEKLIGADLIVNSLQELDPQRLEALF